MDNENNPQNHTNQTGPNYQYLDISYNNSIQSTIHQAHQSQHYIGLPANVNIPPVLPNPSVQPPANIPVIQNHPNQMTTANPVEQRVLRELDQQGNNSYQRTSQPRERHYTEAPKEFPLENEDEFNKFEEKISKNDPKHVLRYYKFVGDGINPRRCIHNIIHATLTPQLARRFTYTGQNKTRGLHDTVWLKLLIKATVHHHPNLTMPEFKKEFGEAMRSYKQQGNGKNNGQGVRRSMDANISNLFNNSD